jgi:hypothetical protein
MKWEDLILEMSDAGFACSKVKKLLPKDLLPYLTVLFQDSGYVTISSTGLLRSDWIKVNDQVRRMGGIWVSNSSYSHWSIPFKAHAH